MSKSLIGLRGYDMCIPPGRYCRVVWVVHLGISSFGEDVTKREHVGFPGVG